MGHWADTGRMDRSTTASPTVATDQATAADSNLSFALSGRAGRSQEQTISEQMR